MNCCSFCGSSKVKKSKTYSNMWFCSDCGKGDYYGHSSQSFNSFLDIKLLAEDSFDILSFIDPDKKTLIITNGPVSNYQKIKNSRVVFCEEINPHGYEYQGILKDRKGVFIFHESSPEILIDTDYKDLGFDRVILSESSNDRQMETIKSLKTLFVFDNKDNKVKPIELFILEKKRKGRYS